MHSGGIESKGRYTNARKAGQCAQDPQRERTAALVFSRLVPSTPSVSRTITVVSLYIAYAPAAVIARVPMPVLPGAMHMCYHRRRGIGYKKTTVVDSIDAAGEGRTSLINTSGAVRARWGSRAHYLALRALV